jgi:hypothetical protein
MDYHEALRELEVMIHDISHFEPYETRKIEALELCTRELKKRIVEAENAVLEDYAKKLNSGGWRK